MGKIFITSQTTRWLCAKEWKCVEKKNGINGRWNAKIKMEEQKETKQWDDLD